MSSDPESREAQEARDAQEAELPGGRRPVVCAEDAGRLDDLPEPDGARATGCPRSVHRAGAVTAHHLRAKGAAPLRCGRPVTAALETAAERRPARPSRSELAEQRAARAREQSKHSGRRWTYEDDD